MERSHLGCRAGWEAFGRESPQSFAKEGAAEPARLSRCDRRKLVRLFYAKWIRSARSGGLVGAREAMASTLPAGSSVHPPKKTNWLFVRVSLTCVLCVLAALTRQDWSSAHTHACLFVAFAAHFSSHGIKAGRRQPGFWLPASFDIRSQEPGRRWERGKTDLHDADDTI